MRSKYLCSQREIEIVRGVAADTQRHIPEPAEEGVLFDDRSALGIVGGATVVFLLVGKARSAEGESRQVQKVIVMDMTIADVEEGEARARAVHKIDLGLGLGGLVQIVGRAWVRGRRDDDFLAVPGGNSRRRRRRNAAVGDDPRLHLQMQVLPNLRSDGNHWAVHLPDIRESRRQIVAVVRPPDVRRARQSRRAR